ncbi:hypothetical protein [Streptomyces sp. NPDC002328]|uniref:hypothetical protein n=1 Tax=Streptomyces sp. NPDC002328 TaxID=3364642 RepID=UPI00367E6C56
MAQHAVPPAATPVAPPKLPLKDIAPWAVFFGSCGGTSSRRKAANGRVPTAT